MGEPTPRSPRSLLRIADLMVAVAVVALLLGLPSLTSERWFWVVVLAAVFGRPWLVNPWILYRNNWIGLDVTYHPLDLDEPEVPETVKAVTLAAAADLASLGFAVLGHFRLEQANSVQISGYVTLFENPRTLDLAKLINSCLPGRVSTTLNFFTEYRDGTAFGTSDRRTPSVTPRTRLRPGSRSFSQVEDARRLYEIHQALADHAGRFDTPVRDPAAFLKEATVRELAAWVARGYRRLDRSSGRLRMTWKGAVVAGWVLTPPVPAVNLAWRRWRAGRVLRRLETG